MKKNDFGVTSGADKARVERLISNTLRRSFGKANVHEAYCGDVISPRWIEFLLTNRGGRKHGAAMVHVVVTELPDISELSLDEQRKASYDFFARSSEIGKGIHESLKRNKESNEGL